MVSRNGAFGILIGAAAGTFFLVLACGSPEDAQSASCANFDPASPFEDPPLEDLIRCAEQGHAYAQATLGVRYAYGDGFPEDLAEAVRWFRLAADQGIADVQNVLGTMYDDGNGVPEDDAEAARWYRLAAEQGHSDAQSSLGRMYSQGEGIPEDLVLAYMWFNLSAGQGDVIAQRNKEIVEQRMAREQIAEAQRLSVEWIATHPQEGGN